jgi:hypothetical protein
VEAGIEVSQGLKKRIASDPGRHKHGGIINLCPVCFNASFYRKAICFGYITVNSLKVCNSATPFICSKFSPLFLSIYESDLKQPPDTKTNCQHAVA